MTKIARRPTKKNPTRADEAGRVVRVAIYTRKSVSEGLEQEFNTLDAQREAVEAFVVSQRSEGWVALSEHYDDGGYTGSNTARPAFQRLLADIEAGKIDTVAVYKIDRFSRSLMDFMKIMESLEQHGVGFTSVTQAFDTRTSTGRMILRLLMTFAEFERETISERTRDKVAASRRRGMWTGGRPVLGFDVIDKRLVVNEDEAKRVQACFSLYLELGSLLAVVGELKARGWRNKSWRSKAGDQVGGNAFDKGSLSNLLKNPLYIGKVRAGNEVFDGAQPAIVDEAAWLDVQSQLRSNSRRHCSGGRPRNRSRRSALLAGLVFCGVCGASMCSHQAKKGDRRYAYYVCATLQKQGAKSCPGSRVATGELEDFVLAQIRGIGRDADLLEATAAADRAALESRRPELLSNVKRLESERGRLATERDNLVDAIAQASDDSPALVARVAELDKRIALVDAEIETTRVEIAALDAGAVDVDELRLALEDLEPLWDVLFPAERARVLDLLIERVEFDGKAGDVAITFRPNGPEAAGLGAAG